ncbi:MAG: DUF3872 domain-containing protein [Prevotellaceae bacterium]|jgi:hypothetical protein|nr:DUF3872 domain-containing protein [Prevotellaceae bacterium]
MKRFASYFLYAMLIASIVCACNDGLDITQKYAFDLLAMPYPKKVVQGETVEIRCTITKSGDYTGTDFYIRYFQTDGKGELKLDDGRMLTPNDLFPLTKEVFRLYYTSQCTDQQNLDIYIEDNFGQVVQKTFSFSNESVDKPKEQTE